MAAVVAEPPVTVRVVQVRFHWSDRGAEGVMSADFHPTQPKLLTAGCDGTVKVWAFDPAAARPALLDDSNNLSELLHFSSAIMTDEKPFPNVARWSPDGSIIAAAYVNGEVVMWKPSDTAATCTDKHDERFFNKEHWAIHHVIKLPNEAVDVSFSACGRYLISCCVSGSVFVYTTVTATFAQQLPSEESHQHDAQHVAFDPLMKLASSFGADRVLRFYEVIEKKSAVTLRPRHMVQKSRAVKESRLFKGGSTAAIRRSSWSPDGALFAAPQGWAAEEDDGFRDCVHLFSRAELSKPFAHLSSQPNRTVVGVKFAPFLLEPFSNEDDEDYAELVSGDELTSRQIAGSWGPSKYRYVLATWTRESVSIYTSGCSAKVCRLYDLHYDMINDVSFTPDARFICVASNDGYITMASFKKPLGRIHTISADTQDPLSRAVALLRAPFKEHLAKVQLEITTPASPKGEAPVVIKKKKKDKGPKPVVAPETATAAPAAPAAEGSQANGAKRSRSPEPGAHGDATVEAEVQAQVPQPSAVADAPGAAVSAEEMAALMDL
jgi:WD40 repeat protein